MERLFFQKKFIFPKDSVSWPLASETGEYEGVAKLREEILKDIISVPFMASPFESSQSANTETRHTVQVPLIYCDQTASNKALQSIEAYITQVCLPLYGNTHTNTSLTGIQTTAFVAEARQIIADCVNAKVADDEASLDLVLFTGSGSTSAVEALIDCIGLKDLVALSNIDSTAYAKPIVFVGPYEHHSNILPWRESGAEIINVPELHDDIDYSFLETYLEMLVPSSAKTHGSSSEDEKLHDEPMHRMIIGTFTAASNVTGKVCDVDRIAILLHAYGALAFFDYATAAPYVPIDMNPIIDGTGKVAYKDAIFISPHKMLGGVNTPGIVVVKKDLVSQMRPPARSGGGTVFWVTHESHRYLTNRVERYEGGTPNIVGIMRAGLTFCVKKQIMSRYEQAWKNEAHTHNQRNHSHLLSHTFSLNCSPPRTMIEYEYETHRYVVNRLSETSPNLFILGTAHMRKQGQAPNNLPIFSFLIKCGNRFLHFNYVCALLNDLFGIQCRGGCMCSGPYSSYLLGIAKESMCCEGMMKVWIPNESNRLIEQALINKERVELLRPGYTRLSLPFKGLQADQVEYVVTALEWIAKNGWAFLSLYECNHKTGQWKHQSLKARSFGQSNQLRLINYIGFADVNSPIEFKESSAVEADWKELLKCAFANAEDQLQRARCHNLNIDRSMNSPDYDVSIDDERLDDDLEFLRWYIYSSDVAQYLQQGCRLVPGTYDLDNIKGSIRPMGFLNSECVKLCKPKVHEVDKVSPTQREVVDDSYSDPYSVQTVDLSCCGRRRWF